MIDLNRFKSFNDARGHQAGDRLLIETADCWRRQMREVDLLARYGGDEFGLLLPRCHLSQGVQVLERVCSATPGDQTCSAGVACWNGSEPAEQLVRRADVALGEAKQAGPTASSPASRHPKSTRGAPWDAPRNVSLDLIGGADPAGRRDQPRPALPTVSRADSDRRGPASV